MASYSEEVGKINSSQKRYSALYQAYLKFAYNFYKELENLVESGVSATSVEEKNIDDEIDNLEIEFLNKKFRLNFKPTITLDKATVEFLRIKENHEYAKNIPQTIGAIYIDGLGNVYETNKTQAMYSVKDANEIYNLAVHWLSESINKI